LTLENNQFFVVHVVLSMIFAVLCQQLDACTRKRRPNWSVETPTEEIQPGTAQTDTENGETVLLAYYKGANGAHFEDMSKYH